MALLRDLVAVSAAVGATTARTVKIGTLADFLESLAADEVALAVAYLSGELPQGKIGVGFAALRAAQPQEVAASPALTLGDVDAALDVVAAIAGKGAQQLRAERLGEMLARASEEERDFLVRLMLGDLRQGSLTGLMIEAIARGAGTPAQEVRRAFMVQGDLAVVARTAFVEGVPGLRAFRLEVFRPVLPMLAKTAGDVEAAVQQFGCVAVEWKIDGARIQVHRRGPETRIYTRNLNDVTARLPEVVEIVAGFEIDAIVLDGEAIALDGSGRPRPFQETMGRFGTRDDVDTAWRVTPLTPFFFDCLHLDGNDLLDHTTADRASALKAAVPDPWRVPRIVTDAPEEARAFFEEATAAGHEGIMVKTLDAGYAAGRRGAGWLKVKPVHTLDLVVLAAEWGSGRRRGRLSNLHLGARDPEGEFVMLGKTFKGLTDEMLAWQTERFLELETHREGHVVYVRPEQVVEVAFDGIQASSRYPGGMALRFARVKGYREDKTAEEADAIETVRSIFAAGPE